MKRRRSWTATTCSVPPRRHSVGGSGGSASVRGSAVTLPRGRHETATPPASLGLDLQEPTLAPVGESLTTAVGVGGRRGLAGCVRPRTGCIGRRRRDGKAGV